MLHSVAGESDGCCGVHRPCGVRRCRKTLNPRKGTKAQQGTINLPMVNQTQRLSVAGPITLIDGER